MIIHVIKGRERVKKIAFGKDRQFRKEKEVGTRRRFGLDLLEVVEAVLVGE